MRVRCLLLAIVLALPAAAFAQSPAAPVVVEHPWARASVGETGAVYMTIKGGAASDALVAVATPAAGKAELHISVNDNGVMKMRPLERIEVAGGGEAVLKPGAMHVMLFGLKAPLKEGDRIPLSLTFEKAGRIEVTVPVMKAGAMGDMNTGDMKM